MKENQTSGFVVSEDKDFKETPLSVRAVLDIFKIVISETIKDQIKRCKENATTAVKKSNL